MCSAPKVDTPKQQMVTPVTPAQAIQIPNTDKAPGGLDLLRISGAKAQ
jgi:hypothetical protein